MPTATPYPAHRAVDVALRSGAPIRLRPLVAADEAALLVFLRELSPRSRMFRFFSGGIDLAGVAGWLIDVDYAERYGIVAVGADDATILAHGMYSKVGGAAAEVAFAVADALQGEGIATTMLAHLADAARSAGIERFTAGVMPENHRMVDVFRASGF